MDPVEFISYGLVVIWNYEAAAVGKLNRSQLSCPQGWSRYRQGRNMVGVQERPWLGIHHWMVGSLILPEIKLARKFSHQVPFVSTLLNCKSL